jgi:hypothetical protein
MNRPTNAAVKIAGIALALSCLGTALAGCGGSDSDGAPKADASQSDAPKSDAAKAGSTDEFCTSFLALYKFLNGADAANPAEAVKGMKEWAADIKEVDPPSDLSDEERHGFEVFVAMVDALPADATAKDIQKSGSDVSAEDNKAAETFGEWTAANCAPPVPPTAEPSAS